MLVGFAGKSGSGKSTMANAMAAATGGIVLSLAAPLKGAALTTHGVLSFFPQKSPEVRKFLQEYAGNVLSNFTKLAYVRQLEELYEMVKDKYEYVFVSDIRTDWEVKFIRERGGIIIYLAGAGGLQGELGQHITEQLPPEACDYVVTQTFSRETFQTVWHLLCSRERKLLTWEYPKPPKIYLGGSIFSNPDFVSKFICSRDLLMDVADGNFEFIIPPDIENVEIWQELVAKYPYTEACQRLVKQDLEILNQCYGGLFLLEQPSMGSAIELFSLALQGKPTVVLTDLNKFYHPFLRVFATEVVYGGLEVAVRALCKYFLLPGDIIPPPQGE